MSSRAPIAALLAGAGAAAAAAALAATTACSPPTAPRSPDDAPFHVHKVVPASDAAQQPATLFLNQPITVYFSAPIDPHSITPDTVRVTDDAGLGIEGKLHPRAQSVAFEPLVPLTPTLDDGSFRPSSTYRLEIAGFPRVNAVRSADGRVLERGFVREFRTVPVDGGSPHGTPLLPVGIGAERFEVRNDVPLEVAAESAVLRLHFTLPPFPPSVTRDAFRVMRLRGSTKAELELQRVQIVRPPLAIDQHPGSTVELQIGELQIGEPRIGERGIGAQGIGEQGTGGGPAILPGDHLFVLLQQGDAAVRDYRGRPVHIPLPAYYKSVTVHPGRWVRLVHEDFERLAFTSEPGYLPFETWEGQAVAAALEQAGTGRLGTLRPARSRTIDLDRPFDRGDGTLVQAQDGTFDFFSVHVPKDVHVTLRSRAPIRLRAAGTIVVDGTLEIDARPGEALEPGLPIAFDQLVVASGCCLVAGGGIRVSAQGRIVHAGDPLPPRKQPLTLVCGGDLVLEGRVPPGTVLAPRGGEVQGAAFGPVLVHVDLTAGLPAGAAPATAAAWTPWYRLPPHHFGPVDFELLGRRGDLEVLVQVAPHDPVEPSRPLLAPDVRAMPQPLPLAAPLSVPSGSHVRFLLRASLRPGGELPALDGLAVIGR